MILLDPRKPLVYILPCDKDKPEEEQVKWHIGPVNIQEEGIIKDSVFVQVGKKFNVVQSNKNIWALHVGLRKVENLKDSSGNIVELPREKEPGDYGIHKITEDFLQRISSNERDLIAAAIIATFEIDPETAKN